MEINKRTFEQFLEENEEAWRVFCFFAMKLKATGRETVGVELVFNQMRWYSMVEMNDGTEFRINSNWKPFFARKFMEDYSCPDFFRTRSCKADVELPELKGAGEQAEIFKAE